jgi:hypothetical protein
VTRLLIVDCLVDNAAYRLLVMAMSTRRSSESPPLMITGSTADPRCHWMDADKLALINFLLDHKAEAGDGGSFKPWNAAAVEMLKHTTKGGMKVAVKCKAKYVAVCTMTVLLF